MDSEAADYGRQVAIDSLCSVALNLNDAHSFRKTVNLCAPFPENTATEAPKDVVFSFALRIVCPIIPDYAQDAFFDVMVYIRETILLSCCMIEEDSCMHELFY